MLRKIRTLLITASLFAVVSVSTASPPAVGMVTNSRSCIVCHANTGPWMDDANLILDMLDKTTMKSVRQPDGTFEITAKRGEPATVITVLGYKAAENQIAPHRNGWIFVDTTRIGTESISKFAPGWEADVIYGCKISGDKSAAYPDQPVTTAPLTVRPTETAKDVDIQLQVLMTSGEAVKNKAKEGLTSNYFSRTVRLKVTD